MMGVSFTCDESLALYGMLAESGSDVILKVDAKGFVIEASRGLSGLGQRDPEADALHLLDIAALEGKDSLAQALAEAMAGRARSEWLEFPAVTKKGVERWFEIRFRALNGEDGAVYGALGVMRNIEERRALSDQLFAATYTDPLTRLTNRGAFVAMLDHMLDTHIGGCLAMFSVDFFRAINMQHGAGMGDEVLVAFADIMRELLREEDLISRIGSERFAVLLPRVTPKDAERICQRVVSTLGEKGRKVGKSNLTITASGGIARIAGSLDSTLERAEMALFTAKAKGRNRLEMEKPRRAA